MRNAITLGRSIIWTAVALVALLLMTTLKVAATTVVVVGDGRWSECSSSGGTPYGDAAGNYGGCDYNTFPDWDVSISPVDPGIGGGGGGGAAPPDLTQHDISEDLECALSNYSHPNVRLTGGRTMRRINTWAFGRQTGPNTWQYTFNSNNAHPGDGWHPVAGTAAPGDMYGRLYNYAFEGFDHFSHVGHRAGSPPNALSGPISGFERSLFTSAHEAAHLLGVASEAEANWYGINAVLNYRSDGGAKCE
jgi:hypothetical protein